MNRLLIAFVSAILVAACTSPEATRERAGGAGADTGNRGDVVLMHEGSHPYAGTPRLIPAEAPPLEPARHADRLSRQ
jgi:hypothetical protein